MYGRKIVESTEFHEAVQNLGGHRFVDEALSTILEALARNPYAFHKFESDFVSFRFARTKRIGIIPPLVFIFRIEKDGTVVLEHVEEEEQW
jgi:hypothetical protein